MVKIFLDGAGLADMARLAIAVDGVTTNPSLMKAAGITDYRAFAREVLAIAAGKPVSFEVLSDDFAEMERQARVLAGWADNVWVKIPAVNAAGASCLPLAARLCRSGVKVNLTAVLTVHQAAAARRALPFEDAIISVFAGRIADTGVDPALAIAAAGEWSRNACPQVLWASAREVFNVRQADDAGADIITLSPALYDKRAALAGKDLAAYQVETVRQFVADAAGLTL
jgi:transaldolase